MSSIALLTARNLRLFFRDRAGVFFSLLSALVLIALYVLFLGNLQIENLKEQLPSAAPEDISWFVTTWVFAGIAMITTLTTALAALSVFVDDNASGRFRDFIVSPIGRTQLVIGYALSSFLVSVLMTAVIVAISQLYVWSQGEPVMSTLQLAQAAGACALSSAAFAALASFVVTFLKSSGAFAALSTVVGTIIGFLAGAYIPAGALPDTVVKVLDALPFAHAAMLIRIPYTERSLQAMAGRQPQAESALRDYYGITAHIGAIHVTTVTAVAVLVAVLVIFAGLGAWRLGRRIR